MKVYLKTQTTNNDDVQQLTKPVWNKMEFGTIAKIFITDLILDFRVIRNPDKRFYY